MRKSTMISTFRKIPYSLKNNLLTPLSRYFVCCFRSNHHVIICCFTHKKIKKQPFATWTGRLIQAISKIYFPIALISLYLGKISRYRVCQKRVYHKFRYCLVCLMENSVGMVMLQYCQELRESLQILLTILSEFN